MQPERLAVGSPAATDAVLREVESRVGGKAFDQYFRDKTSLTLGPDELAVGVASPFLLSWSQRHFREALADTARRLIGPAARVRFEVSAAPAARPAAVPATPAPITPPTAIAATPATATAAPPAQVGQGRRFNDLADFVEGEGTALALAAVRQVCDAPGTRLNPLYLHGGVGLGKTHLLEGIYRRVRRQFPALHVMFITAEAFANYFTEALRDKSLPSFRQRFRTVDVLLVDDVDFLDNKRVIQEEFLHTFKQLESLGRQIVLTADRHPRLLTKTCDELMTRCLSGMVCRLEPPDGPTRQKIALAKAARLGADVAREALDFVAQRFRNNVRELEGALNCLATWHALHGKRVTLTAARRVLADLERDCVRIVRPSDVEQVVSDFFGVPADELRSPRRSRAVSQPRMLAMYLIRKHTQAAYNEIGRHFGGRNHSTVMAAERKVEEGLLRRETLRVASQTWTLAEVVEALEQQLRAS